MNCLIVGDCLKILPGFPADFVDMILTDLLGISQRVMSVTPLKHIVGLTVYHLGKEAYDCLLMSGIPLRT